MRVKNETSRWYCCSSSTIARSKCAEKMSRTTRTERSASWKTSSGAAVSSTRLTSTSWSLCRYFSSRSKSSRLAPWAAVRTITPPPPSVEVRGLAAQALALGVLQPPRHADALAGGRVDHVAPGDRQLHRQARALRLQGVLDDLHDDLLPGLEQVGDLAPPAAAAPALGRLHAGQHDLVDVQEAVLLEADVDERRLEAGQHVVDLALVDVADDRAAAAALDVELSDAVAGLRALRWRACAAAAARGRSVRRRAFRSPPEARRASPRGRR